jgi:hypothetical protein
VVFRNRLNNFLLEEKAPGALLRITGKKGLDESEIAD